MKRLLTVFGALTLAAGTSWAHPPAGPGLGVVLGDPLGGTARYFVGRDRSVDLGIGFSGDPAFTGDFAFHAWDLLPRPKTGDLDAWVSAGVRVEAADDAEFGVRTMLGASYWVQGRAIEVFATAGPVFRMTPSGGVDADGGVGVRFYFGGADGR